MARRVLIVDPEIRWRNATGEAVGQIRNMEVAGYAPNCRVALPRVEHVAPDVVVLATSLPRRELVALVRDVARIAPEMRMVLHGQSGPAVDAALEAGAHVVAHKTDDLTPLKQILGPFGRQRDAVRTPPQPMSGSDRVQRIEVVAIGSSTGGPQALEAIIPLLGADFPVPVVVTQHMPAGFTAALAQQLDRKSSLRVVEGSDGTEIKPGHVYVAPGDWHMDVVRQGLHTRLKMHQGPLENSCRPAVDVMFRSVARSFGSTTLATVLTGMGQDGLRGCEVLRQQGAHIVVQDEATSVVWGMPGFVAKAGLHDKCLPVSEIFMELERRVWIKRQRSFAGGNGKKAI